MRPMAYRLAAVSCLSAVAMAATLALGTDGSADARGAIAGAAPSPVPVTLVAACHPDGPGCGGRDPVLAAVSDLDALSLPAAGWLALAGVGMAMLRRRTTRLGG
ncbi:MAG: hypothetical protein ACFBWO_18195 [Paracoccaceae bacterium]